MAFVCQFMTRLALVSRPRPRFASKAKCSAAIKMRLLTINVALQRKALTAFTLRCLAASGIARAASRALRRANNATGLSGGDPRPEEERLIDALPLRRTGRMKLPPMQRG